VSAIVCAAGIWEGQELGKGGYAVHAVGKEAETALAENEGDEGQEQ